MAAKGAGTGPALVANATTVRNANRQKRGGIFTRIARERNVNRPARAAAAARRARPRVRPGAR